MILKNLWTSSRNLYLRFRLEPSIKNAINGITEESLEVFEAIDALSKDENDLVKRQHLAQEVADLFVVAISALLAMNITYPELEYAIQSVIDKNDAKDSTTHVVWNDKVTRKEKVIHYEND